MTLNAIDKALRENACSGKTKAALEGFEPRPFPFCKFNQTRNDIKTSPMRNLYSFYTKNYFS